MTRSYKPTNDILDEFNERINALERLAKRIDNRFTVRVPTLDFNNPPQEATQNEIRIDSNTQSIYWYQEPDWITVSGSAASTVKEIVTYSISGTVAVANGQLRYYPNGYGTISLIFGSLGTPAQSGGPHLIFRVRKTNYLGVTVTVGTVDMGNALSYNYVFPTSPENAFSAGDYIVVDVTQVGSPQPGRDLVVQIELVRDPA